MARYVGRSSVCCQQNKYVIEARAGQPAFAFFVRKFFAVQYRCIFCRETATLSTTSVTVKIRESFCPCNFVVSSYSKALRIPLRQNMSAGHLFAVSKINTLSRQGQGNLPFPLIRICKRRANTCFFLGKRLSLK